jgi:TM2 domain-containing membrane protein YozV
MKSLLLTYILWFFGGFFGLHKFYLNRPVMGLLYFFTGGFFVVGWLIDFFTLPRQVRIANLLQQNELEGLSATLQREFSTVKQQMHDLLDNDPGARRRPALHEMVHPHVKDEDVMVGLLRAAHKHSGRLSVTTGVMETGLSFATVERVLKRMVESGYVYMDNDLETGVVIYVFKEVF